MGNPSPQIAAHPGIPAARISIITALRDKGTYIGETISSVRAQSVDDWEMIVVENGSTDNGPEIVAQVARAEPRIRIIHAPGSSRGPGAARNLGLDHAAGEWILFLDADDLIQTTHLENLRTVVDANPEADLIAGGWREFTSTPAETSPDHIPSTFGFCKEMLLARSVAVAPWILHAALVRKSILHGPNRWPEHLDPYPDEDTAFWFTLLTDAKVAWHRGCGALYRKLHQGSRSTSGSLMERIEGHTKIISHNLALAETRNIRLLPRAACSISMIYEVYYRKALESGELPARDLALRLSTTWLRDCDCPTWNTRLRKLIGIRAVNFLRSFFR